MKKVAILAGGNSGEYEVSLKTAQNILNILDKNLLTSSMRTPKIFIE